MSSIVQFPDGTTIEFDPNWPLRLVSHICESMFLGYRMRWRPDPKPASAIKAAQQ